MTALAEAELEYPDGHTSRAAYVTFPLCDPPAAAAPLHQVLIACLSECVRVWSESERRANALWQSASSACASRLNLTWAPSPYTAPLHQLGGLERAVST